MERSLRNDSDWDSDTDSENDFAENYPRSVENPYSHEVHSQGAQYKSRGQYVLIKLFET